MTYIFNSGKLIALRKARFWTQDDLAAASGISARTIQRMEKSKSASIESWKAVAAAFDVSPESLQLPAAQNLTQAHPVKFGKHRAAAGAALCCAAGLVGCSFGWWQIFSGPADFHEAVSEYRALTAAVTFATALCFIVPIVTWKRI